MSISKITNELPSVTQSVAPVAIEPKKILGKLEPTEGTLIGRTNAEALAAKENLPSLDRAPSAPVGSHLVKPLNPQERNERQVEIGELFQNKQSLHELDPKVVEFNRVGEETARRINGNHPLEIDNAPIDQLTFNQLTERLGGDNLSEEDINKIIGRMEILSKNENANIAVAQTTKEVAQTTKEVAQATKHGDQAEQKEVQIDKNETMEVIGEKENTVLDTSESHSTDALEYERFIASTPQGENVQLLQDDDDLERMSQEGNHARFRDNCLSMMEDQLKVFHPTTQKTQSNIINKMKEFFSKGFDKEKIFAANKDGEIVSAKELGDKEFHERSQIGPMYIHHNGEMIAIGDSKLIPETIKLKTKDGIIEKKISRENILHPSLLNIFHETLKAAFQNFNALTRNDRKSPIEEGSEKTHVHNQKEKPVDTHHKRDLSNSQINSILEKSGIKNEAVKLIIFTIVREAHRARVKEEKRAERDKEQHEIKEERIEKEYKTEDNLKNTIKSDEIDADELIQALKNPSVRELLADIAQFAPKLKIIDSSIKILNLTPRSSKETGEKVERALVQTIVRIVQALGTNSTPGISASHPRDVT